MKSKRTKCALKVEHGFDPQGAGEIAFRVPCGLGRFSFSGRITGDEGRGGPFRYDLVVAREQRVQ